MHLKVLILWVLLMICIPFVENSIRKRKMMATGLHFEPNRRMTSWMMDSNGGNMERSLSRTAPIPGKGFMESLIDSCFYPYLHQL